MEEQNHVVYEKKVGNVTVRVCDDFCVSPEEAKVIVNRVKRRFFPYLYEEVPSGASSEINKEKGVNET